MSGDIPIIVLVVVLGGLFGWLLGKLPDRWVYLIAAIVVVFALVIFARAG